MLAPPLGRWRPLLGEILDPPLSMFYYFFRIKGIYNNKVNQNTAYVHLNEFKQEQYNL